MCGICGAMAAEKSLSRVQAMLPRLAHRGPDSQLSWSDDGVALGHTRLAIVDLSPSGNQPMHSEDGQTVLVGNGEIYNSDELRRELEGLGHRFSSRSDNETLLHLYEQYGLEAFQRVNGMFAAGIWDARRRRLVLVRDRMGIKPLYYSQVGTDFYFASEIKALAECPGAVRGIDPDGLRQYLTYQNTFADRTLHAGIRLVEPGQYVLFENSKIDRATYWNLDWSEEPTIHNFQDACESFRNTARESVNRHLMSDVPVASYLSAGIDSTTVATLAADQVSRQLQTFTGSFGLDGWYDEGTGAQAVAGRIGSLHSEVAIQAEDLKSAMDPLIAALDEPRMGPGSFSQYSVAARAAQKARVILTGHGGDELFSGYPVFKAVQFANQARRNPISALWQLRKTRSAEWPHLAYFWMGKFRGRPSQHFLPVLFSAKHLRQSLEPQIAEVLLRSSPEAALDDMTRGHDDPYRRLMTIYLRAYLPGLFVVEDKISMAHSLESRTPLCDNALVAMSQQIHPVIKLTGNTLKSIPKTAMRDRLPDLLYRLPKRGFPTPLTQWFRGPLRKWMADRLTGPESGLIGLFEPTYLKRTLERYQASPWQRIRPLDEIQTHRIWMLLSLESWLRQTRNLAGKPLELAA